MNAPNDEGKQTLTHQPKNITSWNSRSSSLGFEEMDYSWEQAVRILRKNRRMAFAIAGSLITLFVLIAVMMKDVYRPVARLDLEPPTSGIKTLHEIESNPEAENQDYLETQVQILKSDALAVSVIRDLHLEKDVKPVSTAKSETAKNENQMQKHGSEISNQYLRDQFELANLTPSEAAALDKFRRNLSVDVVRNTRLVEVGYASNDPQTAQKITNAVVEKFIDSSFKHRYTTTMQVSAWLSAQLNDLRQKLEASNQAVSDYQRKYGLIELDGRDVPMSQLMSEVNHQLSDAQANRIEAEAFVRMIDLGEADSIPVVKDNQIYQNLLTRYADVRVQLAQARTVYGDANINVRKLDDQTSELSAQIDAERARIADRLRTSYEAAKERERLMLKSREKLRGQMGDVSSQLVGYHLLKNEAMANAELYNTLQGRLQEAGIYAGLRSNNIRVVDLATNLQKATGPNRGLLISSGVLLAFLVAIPACFVRESLDNTVRTPDDVKSWIGLRSLALLPAVEDGKAESYSKATGFGKLLNSKDANRDKTAPATFVLMQPLGAGAEAMRDLRTSLLSSRSERMPEVVLISSSMEGEGKSTVAVNFALALAQLGRTCLVDGDLRQPAVSRVFGLDGKAGLAEVLSGKTSLVPALFPIDIASNLWILPSGQSQESPADVLASSRINDVCSELRRTFEYVVIDSPPVNRFSDARFLSRLADEVVLVGRYGITTRRAIQRSAELLREAQAPIAGFVLNGIDLASSDYRYFTYGYSKTFNKSNERLASWPGSSPAKSQMNGNEKGKGAHA